MLLNRFITLRLLVVGVIGLAVTAAISCGKTEKNSSLESSRKVLVATDKNQLPTDVRKVLESADTFVLYSLDPDQFPPGETTNTSSQLFHGYVILGKTELQGSVQRDGLLAALYEGVSPENALDPAACFNPRHGIKASLGNEAVELVICFECWRIKVLSAQGQTGVVTTPSPQPIFDQVLQEARVPLPKKKVR